MVSPRLGSYQDSEGVNAEIVEPSTTPVDVLSTSEAKFTQSEPPNSSILIDPSPENIPELTIPTTPPHTNDTDISARYTLPFRHN